MSENEGDRRDVRQIVEEAAGDAPPLREDEAAAEIALDDDLLPIPDLEMIPDDEIDNRRLNGFTNRDNNPDDENNDNDDDNDDGEAQLNRNQFPQELLQELRMDAFDLLFYVPNPEQQQQQQQLINGNGNDRREGRPFIIHHRRQAIDRDEPDNGNNDNNRN